MAAPSNDFESADYAPLRVCSLAARGLWADMRVLMKNNVRRGFLTQEGQPMRLRQIAVIAGLSSDEARHLVQELTDAGVCSIAEDGTYFSARIVKYDSFARECGKAGKRGGGNPDLKRLAATYKGSPTFIGGSKGRSKGCPKVEKSPPPSPALSPTPPIPTPTHAPISPTAGARTGTEIPDPAAEIFAKLDGWELSGLPQDLQCRELRLSLATYILSLRELGKAPSPTGWRHQISWLSKLPLDRALAAIEYSTRNSYTGLHEPKENKPREDSTEAYIRRGMAKETP